MAKPQLISTAAKEIQKDPQRPFILREGVPLSLLKEESTVVLPLTGHVTLSKAPSCSKLPFSQLQN